MGDNQLHRGLSSSSTTGLPSRSRWDVFLSFRGEDTRHTFTQRLYTSLVRSGVRTFRDDDELRHGEEISAGLVEAIRDSAAAIAVISRRYADSRWCLEELARILESRKLLLPVFYGVNPSDVRRQKGPFEDDMTRMEEKYGKEVVGRWRRAMEKAGGLRGWDSTLWEEEKLIESLVKEVLTKLSNTPMGVAKYPVGLDARLEELMRMLDVKANDVRVLGLYGIGGAGKTTLAKALYNKLVVHFRRHSFISNVKETSKQENGLATLQNELLRDLSRSANLEANSDTSRFRELIHEEPVLIVLDDIDDARQIDLLVGKKHWYYEGSRIILTTRDKGTTPEGIVDKFYEMKELKFPEALQLFSYHAFGREEPITEFKDLCEQVVSLTGGLPLALEVFGSSFFEKRRKKDWEEALKKLQQIRPHRLQDVLEISFTGLDQQEQCAFLDIACLFVKMRMSREDVVYVLRACGFSGETLITTLVSKSLIKFVQDDVLWMHDQLRDMGRQIVQRENDEPGMRSRLWHYDEIVHVLKNEKGTRNCQGIAFVTGKRRHELSTKDTYWFNFKKRPTFSSAIMYLKEIYKGHFHQEGENGKDVKLHTRSFKSMTSLRLLQIDDVELGGSFKFMPREVKFLRWQGCPLRRFPSGFHMQHLAFLDLSESKVTKLWEHNWWNLNKTNKIAEKLLVMNLQGCARLTHLPDLSGHSSFEKLILLHCKALVSVHKSVGDLKKLLYLNLGDCTNLVELPSDVSGLKRLEILILSNCSKLTKLPGDMRSMKCLRELVIDYTRIVELPDSMLHLKKLEKFSLKDCKSFKELPNWIGQLSSLKELSLDGSGVQEIPNSIGLLTNLGRLSLMRCKSIRQIPEAVGRLSSLTELLLDSSSIEELPDSLGSLSHLRDLSVSYCRYLTKLPDSIGGLASLIQLRLRGASIAEVPDQVGSLILLEELDMGNCQSIASLPKSFGKMLSLTKLDLDEMRITEMPESIGMLESLIRLKLNQCRELQRLPATIGNLRSLCYLFMAETSVSELPPEVGKLTSLTILKMGKKPQNSQIRGDEIVEAGVAHGSLNPSLLPKSLSNLSLLRELDACGWKLSGAIPDEFERLTSLEELNLSHNDFSSLPHSLRGLSILKKLNIAHCKELKALPQLPSNLLKLYAANCTALENTGDLANLLSLHDLDLSNCNKLTDIPGLEYLKSLRKLYVGGCNTCFPAVKERLSKVALKRLMYLSVPGRVLPDWFVQEIPRFSQPRNRDIKGIIIGVVISLNQQTRDAFRDKLPGLVDVKAKILRLGEETYTNVLDLRGVPNTDEDQLYMCRFADFDKLVLILREGDGLQIGMRDRPLFSGLSLKSYGFHLIFENDDDTEDADEEFLVESQRSVSWKLAKFFGSL